MNIRLFSGWILFALWMVGCQPTEPSTSIVPKPGIWQATLSITEEAQLPFNFLITTKVGHPYLSIINGEDTLSVTDVMMKGDSLIIQLPVYHAAIRTRVSDSVMSGRFHNYYRGKDYTIPFHARYGIPHRFDPGSFPVTDISGRWEVWFGADTAELDQAIGIFDQTKGELQGTFLTPYGDYRYLSGVVTADSLYLSNFDGMHVMYFAAALGDTLRGIYRSGNHFSEPWVAWRNDTLQLPDAFRLASATSPFTLPGSDSVQHLIAGKPSIIQLMGTWCPNCKDEALILDKIYQANRDKLQVVGLSFERTKERQQALTNIKRTRAYLNLSYPVFYAGFANQEGVAKVVPQLKGFSAYPTTLFVYGDGKVAAVHTGFSGPATGEAYVQTVAAYNDLVEELLAY